jgi:hypothetical protein
MPWLKTHEILQRVLFPLPRFSFYFLYFFHGHVFHFSDLVQDRRIWSVLHIEAAIGVFYAVISLAIPPMDGYWQRWTVFSEMPIRVLPLGVQLWEIDRNIQV